MPVRTSIRMSICMSIRMALEVGVRGRKVPMLNGMFDVMFDGMVDGMFDGMFDVQRGSPACMSTANRCDRAALPRQLANHRHIRTGTCVRHARRHVCRRV